MPTLQYVFQESTGNCSNKMESYWLNYKQRPAYNVFAEGNSLRAPCSNEAKCNPLLVCIKCKLLPFSLCCISMKMFLSTPFLTTEDCEGMCMQHTSLFPRASLLFSTLVLKQVLMVSGTSLCARFRVLLKEKTINPLTFLQNDRESVIFEFKRNN